LLAALELGHAPAEQIATLEKELLGELSLHDGVLSLRETSSSDELHEYMSSDVRSSAIALRALLLVDPKNAANGKLAAGLLRSRDASNEWVSTQDNLYALVALAAYAKQRVSTPGDISVKLGEKTILAKKRGVPTASLQLPADRVHAGLLRVDSTGSAFVSITLVRARRDDGSHAVEQGLSLSRVYLDAKTGVGVSSAKPGQLVRVHLTLRSEKEHHYIALVDPLPAGFEPVNAALAGNEDTDDDRYSRIHDWYRDRWVHQEMRDDRMQAFADFTSSPEITLDYLVRAAVSGRFNAAPATVEEMYHPEVRARTMSARIDVGK
jgi:hypothetical protein